MSSMRDYMDCVPLEVRHKRVHFVPTKKFVNISLRSTRNCIDGVLFAPNKLDVKNGISRKLLRNFQIQRQIDLHGFNKDEAFNALGLFFAKCQQDGVKSVLVITGGNAMKTSVLRMAIQKWIPNNFSLFVSSYSQARPDDGGQGAYYVVVRQKKFH